MKRKPLTLLAGLSLLVLTACGNTGSDLPQTALPPGSPYAGGAQYPWTDKLEVPVANPYAGGRDYPWKSAIAVAQNQLSSQAFAGGDNVLSDLPWTSATNGWGPVERNRSNGQMNAGDGKTISIRGQKFNKGLGVHAFSTVEYGLNRQCQKFTATIGIDDEVGGLGRATFYVIGDGRVLYASPELTGKSAGLPIEVDVTGVKQLRLNVVSGDAIHYDHADWADAKVNCIAQTPNGKVNLSDLTYASATNGWGPVEFDSSNGEQVQFDGKPLTVAGQTYASGFGVHAPSSLIYTLDKQCMTLTALAGIDNEVPHTGSVVFEVLGDGRSLYKSGVTRKGQLNTINVGLAGVQTLELRVTDAGDGKSFDHADWLNPVLQCAAPSTTPNFTLTTDQLDIFHKHSATMQAQFTGVTGKVDLRLVADAPEYDPAIQLKTTSINVDGTTPTYDIGFFAGGLPSAIEAPLSSTYRLIASQNGRDIASTELTINEKLLKVTATVTPGTLEARMGETKTFTVSVKIDPPLETMEDIEFDGCRPNGDCDFGRPIPVSGTYGDGGLMKRDYQVTFTNTAPYPSVGETVQIDYGIRMGDFLGYRMNYYWTTSATGYWLRLPDVP